MSSLLFDQLDNSGLLKDGVVNFEKIKRSSVADLVDVARESIALTSAVQLGRADSPYVHTASMTLSGGDHPCSRLSCRIEHVDRLSQFASLYSDSVYVHNLLGDHAHHAGEYTAENLPGLQRSFAEDLAVLNHLRPLVEAGRIVPVTAPLATCAGCGSAMISLVDTEMEQRLQAARPGVFARYEDEIVVDFEMHGERLGASMHGPEELLEHGERATLLMVKTRQCSTKSRECARS